MSAVAYGSVRLRECVNTEFVWEFKKGFVKAGVSCPLTRVSVKRASTATDIFSIQQAKYSISLLVKGHSRDRMKIPFTY